MIKNFKDKDWDGPPLAESEEEFEEMTKEKEQRLIQKAQEKRRKQIEEPQIEEPKEERKIEVYHIEGGTKAGRAMADSAI